MTDLFFRLFRQHSLLAVIIIVVFALCRSYFVQASLPTEGQELLKRWIAGEYSSAAIVKKPQSGSEEELVTWSKTLVRPEDITFISINAKGITKKDIIVRADIRVKGLPPPDGPSIRYYRMEYSLLLGWFYRHPTNAFSYYSRLW